MGDDWGRQITGHRVEGIIQWNRLTGEAVEWDCAMFVKWIVGSVWLCGCVCGVVCVCRLFGV